MESIGMSSKRIAETIARTLEKGISIDRDTLFFLESTFGVNMDSFEALLRNGDFEEIETVRNLVFSPPFSTQKAVELFLLGETVKTPDQEQIVLSLLNLVPSVRMVLPDSSWFLCQLCSKSAGIIVEKLHSGRNQDPEVRDLLLENLSEEQAIEVLVYIRCKA